MNNYEIDWSDIVFGSKKCLRELKAVLIAPSREMSIVRLTQLVKQYLPNGNIVIACSKESYIDGFEGQPQFRTLSAEIIKDISCKVNKSPSPHKITLLHCEQSDMNQIYEKVKFSQVILVNGSWKNSFHTRPEYYTLISNNIPFEFVSPFADEVEAKKYADDFEVRQYKSDKLLTEIEMFNIANLSAINSFDNNFQTGVALGKRSGDKYKLILTAFNKTVPYQSFAWHFGPLRERHLCVAGDLNYYDTIHAEVLLLVNAQKEKISLKDTVLFINLLPCPNCARMLCETDINEVIYSIDHSGGYAVALLEKAGKKVTRLIDSDSILRTEESYAS